MGRGMAYFYHADEQHRLQIVVKVILVMSCALIKNDRNIPCCLLSGGDLNRRRQLGNNGIVSLLFSLIIG